MLDRAAFVDEEETAVSNQLAFAFHVAFFVWADELSSEDVIVLGDGLIGIGDQRVGDPFDAALALSTWSQPQWENSVSVETPMTTVSRFVNSGSFSWNAWSSVGQTNVEVLRIEEEDDVFVALELGV